MKSILHKNPQCKIDLTKKLFTTIFLISCLFTTGHDQLAQLIQNKRISRDTPEELAKIQELEEQVETLKMETRNRLCLNIDKKYEELTKIRSLHEREIESMTRQIDHLQEQLEEAMKSRLSMITRQVRIGK